MTYRQMFVARTSTRPGATTLPFAPPLHFFDKTLAAFTRWIAQEADTSPEVRTVGRPKAKNVNWAMNEAFLWIDLYRAANPALYRDAMAQRIRDFYASGAAAPMTEPERLKRLAKLNDELTELERAEFDTCTAQGLPIRGDTDPRLVLGL